MIIGFSGYAQSGKDTAAAVLTNFERRSFAEPMRSAMYALNPIIKDELRLADAIDDYGWDKAKVMFPEIRRLLQVFGTEVGRKMWDENFWITMASRGMTPNIKNYVFTDVRFPNELKAIKDAGGVTIRVIRDGVEPVNAHPSETALNDYIFDFTINNDGTVEQLQQVVLNIVEAVNKKLAAE